MRRDIRRSKTWWNTIFHTQKGKSFTGRGWIMLLLKTLRMKSTRNA
nr:MAG TPA: hypothetical protein [Caudoviricetes sp.]